jgi:polyisoprenoid-binding protein YceI
MRKALLPLLAVSLLASGLCSTAALAAERTLSLDPAHTEVTFLLGATGHDVHGVLHLQGGVIRFDAAAGTASGDVVIDARLAETGNAKRDKTMHAKVLNSVSFPSMVFHARSIEGELQPSGHSEITLVGTVTLVGKDHPLSLPTQVDVDGSAVSASATFTVPFVEWGLHDPSTFILKVAKKVDVSIAAKGTLDEVAAGATGAGAGG